jgi:hypothetical protein
LKYKELLFDLIAAICSDANKFRSVKVLLRSIPAEEFFETSQHALSLSYMVNFLQKDHKRLNEPIIRKYVSAYRDFGDHMEKIIRILVAIKEILEGNSVKFSDIKKYNTNNHVGRLKSDSKFRGLLTPFNVVVCQ